MNAVLVELFVGCVTLVAIFAGATFLSAFVVTGVAWLRRSRRRRQIDERIAKRFRLGKYEQ